MLIHIVEKGHGRITNWEVSVESNLQFIDDAHLWEGLVSVVKVTTTTTHLTQIRNQDADQNFFLFRKIGLNIVNQAKTKGMSVKRMKIRAALDDEFRAKVLNV